MEEEETSSAARSSAMSRRLLVSRVQRKKELWVPPAERPVGPERRWVIMLPACVEEML